MNDYSVYKRIENACADLKLNLSEQEMALLSKNENLSEDNLYKLLNIFEYLVSKKHLATVETCLRLSRLPRKSPKSFDNFDFAQLQSKHMDEIMNLSSLSDFYSHRNLAFIGPQGTGKTHLAMAYGRKCCELGFKSYFITAGELNDRITRARKLSKVDSLKEGLVKYSCLIVDEIGRCVFDGENTRIFFDIIDRRYKSEGPGLMIFTSNKSVNSWKEYFSDDDSLLCALDRIFDDATTYILKGKSYRGKGLKTVAVEVGGNNARPVTEPSK